MRTGLEKGIVAASLLAVEAGAAFPKAASRLAAYNCGESIALMPVFLSQWMLWGLAAMLIPSVAYGAVEILADVECGGYVEKVEWVARDKHARLLLKDGIPNHWWIFSLRGVQGRTLTLEVVGQETIHKTFPWKGVQPFVTDAVDLSNPLLYDEAAYQRQLGKLPWRRIEKSRFDAATKTLTMEASFGANEATVALKFPCPPSYVEKRLAQLVNRVHSGELGLYEAGRTAEGRPLRVLTVPANHANLVARWKEKPTFLIYGGEHATEYESMQVVMGTLEWLLGNSPEAQTYRSRYNVMLIPQFSPDDAAKSVFGRVVSGFLATEGIYSSGPENKAWANFFNDYMDAGFRLDAVLSLHNVAGSEAPNFYCPLMHLSVLANEKFVRALHGAILKQMEETRLKFKPGLGGEANESMRLVGFLEESFGPTGMFYEVNSQAPSSRLSLTELRGMSVPLLRGLAAYAESGEIFQQQRQWQQARMARRNHDRTEILRDNPIFTREYIRNEKRFLFNYFW